jgi:plasmid stabilization system protein ParE
VSRFLLSADAELDLEDLDRYLERLPAKPALAIAAEIYFMLNSIGDNPYMGIGHSELTRAFGEEIRSRAASTIA